MEAVDVLEDGCIRLSACLPGSPSDQLGFDCLEEGEGDQETVHWTVFPTQNSGIVVAVALAAHPLPGSGCLHLREGTP